MHTISCLCFFSTSNLSSSLVSTHISIHGATVLCLHYNKYFGSTCCMKTDKVIFLMRCTTCRMFKCMPLHHIFRENVCFMSLVHFFFTIKVNIFQFLNHFIPDWWKCLLLCLSIHSHMKPGIC